MLTIDQNNGITLTKGDSAVLELTIQDSEGNTYDYSNDLVEFGVKRSALDKTEPILKKTFEDGKITFTPEDTEAIEGYGDFQYDVQVTHTDEVEGEEVDTVYTVIAAARFTLGYNIL